MQESRYLKVFLENNTNLKGQHYLVERFGKLPYLSAFNDEQLRMILESSKVAKYEAGEEILKEGEPGRTLFILLFGEVKVVKGGAEVCRFSKTGDVFGEMAVIDGKPRSATVIAATETACLSMDVSFLDSSDGQGADSAASVFYRTLAMILSHRLRDTSEELALARKEPNPGEATGAPA